MKRSSLNRILQESRSFLDRYGWHLPAWADWERGDWERNKELCRSVWRHNLGWDVTDFGSGRFEERGLVLFTLRNGLPGGSGKDYAEKIMIVRENQETPLHFHWSKMEDIINRGGGDLVFQLYKAGPEEELSQEELTVRIDDCLCRVRGGEPVVLRPGQSLCLEPRVYHRFYAAPGGGAVLTGEVSRVNDDGADNRFYEDLGRFPAIEEDEPPFRYLCCDYPRLEEELA